MTMYLNLAWRNIWRNKRRTLITISSIFFAVLLAIFMRSMQLGSYNHMIKNVVTLNTGYAQIHAAGYWNDQTLENTFEADSTMIRTISQIEHVTQVIPRLESFALAATEELTKGVIVIGVDPEKEDQLTGLKDRRIKGDYLQANDNGVLVVSGLAEYLQVSVGDTLVLIGQGYHAMSAAGKYPIRGIIEFPTPELNRQLVYLTLSEAQWFYSAPNRLTSLALNITDQKYLSEVMHTLRATLDTATYEIMDWSELMPEIVQSIQLDNAGGLIMLWLLYLIIGFGIFNTLVMMIAERMREFGVLVAVGMRQKQLVGVILIESIFLAWIGVTAGMITGIPMLIYMHYHPIHLTGEAAEAVASYGMEPVLPFSVEPGIFFAQAGAVLLLAGLAAIYPVVRLLRLRAVDAMRY
ncbi:MAG: ABC transporter permease [Gemmatimonadetes bacterium]|nr:MAG: ABC transporter permease [Gemmatimonadota bacterium]